MSGNPRKSNALTVDGGQRLERLLGMIGSDHDAEALTAARMAHKLLRDNHMVWADVIRWPDDQREMPWTEPDAADVTSAWPLRWAKAVQLCVRHRDLLSQRDADFVTILADYRDRTPSEAQLRWLHDVVHRLRAKGACP